jgi:hypothetical protein
MQRVAVAALFVGAALVGAGPAHADPEDAYIAELQRRGVDYSTPAAAIKLGKATCLALQDGNSVMAVLNTIEDQGGSPATTPASSLGRRRTLSARTSCRQSKA